MTICITPRDWVANREPRELSQYIFKRAWTSYFLKSITKPCTQLHPPQSTSTELTSTSTQLHLPPTSSLQPPPSSLQHPQENSNKNIIRNWLISPNLGRKIQSCSFWLKIGSHRMLEVVIPNPDFDFWNSYPKIHFWANLGSKSQSCMFCLKIGTHGISRMLILIPTLIFWNSNPKIHFWANLGQKKSKLCVLLNIGSHGISRMRTLIPTLVFWIFNSKFLFGQIWTKKVKVVHFALKLANMVSSGNWFLFRHQFSEFRNLISFLGNIILKKSNYLFLLKIATPSIMRMLIVIES